MKNKIKLFSITAKAILLFSVFISLATVAHAAQITSVSVDPKNDFVLEPGKVEIFMNPGESQTREIYITDRIPGTTSFKVEVEDMEGSQDPNTPVVILNAGETGPNSGKNFITPDTQSFTLSFGQRITIPVNISIPASASPGGYYSSVLVSNVPNSDLTGSSTDQAQGSTKVISRLGALFFLRVNGKVNESGSLSDFRIQGPQKPFYEQGPFTFEILYNNTGSVHLVPYGMVTIKNTLGKQVASLPVDAYFSLPNSLRSRTITWDTAFLFGRYTATVDLNRGYGNIVDSRTIVFWVLPWKILVGTFIVVFLIALLLIFFFRTFELRKK